MSLSYLYSYYKLLTYWQTICYIQKVQMYCSFIAIQSLVENSICLHFFFENALRVTPRMKRGYGGMCDLPENSAIW